MNSRETLHAIETTTALGIMGITYKPKGTYVSFPCPNECESNAIIKTYGDKKKLWYFRKCKLPEEMNLIHDLEYLTSFTDRKKPGRTGMVVFGHGEKEVVSQFEI